MLNPIVIAADATALLMAGSKLLKTSQPLWAKLPRWLSVALPVIVAVVPSVLSSLADVQSGVDLANVAVMAAALLVPGIAEAEGPAPAPPAPPAA